MGHFVRLACLRHAASVHPEPGSNSPIKIKFKLLSKFDYKNINIPSYLKIDVLLSFQRSNLVFIVTDLSDCLIIVPKQ